MVTRLEIIPIVGIPEIRPGDDLGVALLDAITGADESVVDGDVVVVTHKVVSKAEGRLFAVPDDASYRRLVESEADTIVRRRGDLVITKTRHGFICANAGVDRSNTDEATAVLLPVDPDRSAHRLRIQIERATGTSIAVVVTDTFGRPWRRGLVDVAIGISGVPAIVDLRQASPMRSSIGAIPNGSGVRISLSAWLALGTVGQLSATLKWPSPSQSATAVAKHGPLTGSQASPMASASASAWLTLAVSGQLSRRFSAGGAEIWVGIPRIQAGSAYPPMRFSTSE